MSIRYFINIIAIYIFVDYLSIIEGDPLLENAVDFLGQSGPLSRAAWGIKTTTIVWVRFIMNALDLVQAILL